MHGFRTYDLNFAQNLYVSQVQTNSNARDAYRRVARMWLGISEDFRRDAFYLTFSSIHALLGAYFFAAAFLTDFFIGGVVYIPFVMIGSTFIVLSLVAALGRYRVISKSKNRLLRHRILRHFALHYERSSFKMSKFFPPLMPPLTLRDIKRNSEIQQLIDQDSEIKSYLENLPDHFWLGAHNL